MIWHVCFREKCLVLGDQKQQARHIVHALEEAMASEVSQRSPESNRIQLRKRECSSHSLQLVIVLIQPGNSQCQAWSLRSVWHLGCWYLNKWAPHQHRRWAPASDVSETLESGKSMEGVSACHFLKVSLQRVSTRLQHQLPTYPSRLKATTFERQIHSVLLSLKAK